MQGLSFEARAEITNSFLARAIFRLIANKKTNLCLSADVTSSHSLLTLADRLGPEICCLKTHIDIIDDFTPSVTEKLREIADHHSFFLFEDRKFADIGNTVKHQFAGGIYRIADWADVINAHSLPGPGIIEGLFEAANKKQRGLLLLAEMSSKGNLLNADYVKETLKLAEGHKDFVIGFITQHAISKEPHWINFTPGVQLNASNDKLGQQYISPEKAILENKTDIIIVGRGIIGDQDPLRKAKEYRERAWSAYERRIS